MSIIIQSNNASSKCAFPYTTINHIIIPDHLNAKYARSRGCLSDSHASQSDLVVLPESSVPSNEADTPSITTYGNNPIALTFQIPNASSRNCINTYTSFTATRRPRVEGVSYLANAALVLIKPWMGPLNSMNTIIMLKIWRLLPDMYIMIPFMGSCLEGAMAISQAFFIFRASVSSGFLGVVCCCCWR